MKRIKMSVLMMGLIAGQAIAGGDDPDFDPDFGFDFIIIGDVDNPAYEDEFGLEPDGRGSVSYEFRIARMELTSGQYLEFFNLFYEDFEQYFTLLPRSFHTSFWWVGPGVPLRYANGFNDPAIAGVQISWRQAAMFCNWMHNGQRDDWESVLDGVYDTSTFGPRDPKTFQFPDQSAHHPDARYWIPTLDEYLKAVFYDPDKTGNGPGWWIYGHSSDVEIVPGLPGVGQVARDLSEEVIRKEFGLAVTDGTIPLGIYPDVQSPWGLLDVLGGNQEWMEDWEDNEPRSRFVNGSSNGIRGLSGRSVDPINRLINSSPSSSNVGFRIASAVRHPADFNSDWKVDFFDVSEFIARFAASDMVADINNDGALSVDDVLLFIGLVLGSG